MYKIVSYATSANMGPGFDTLGVCLSLSNTFFFSEFYDGVIVNHATDTIRNRENLVVKSFFTASEILGYKVNGLRLEAKSAIPQARGLGSSASCISAGVAAAFLMSGTVPQKSDIYQVAAQIEGHPDNVCPAIFGGMTLSYLQDDKYKCINYEIDPKYSFIAITPNYHVPTQKARDILPQLYPKDDVVFNLRHFGMLTSALQLGDDELLSQALDDKLHQPYRMALIPGYSDICSLCLSCGAIGTYLSGSGPTVMAIATEEDFVKKLNGAFSQRSMEMNIMKLNVNYSGLEIYKGK